MSPSLSRAAPMRFLIGVVLFWVVGRGLALVGWQPAPATRHDVRHWAAPLAASSRPHAFGLSAERQATAGTLRPVLPALLARAVLPVHAASSPGLILAALKPPAEPLYRRADGSAEPGAIQPAVARHHASRWSGSAWAFVRGGGRSSPLSPGAQIGGGQAGARLLYHLDPAGTFSAAARLSGTIGGARQTEAAVGVDWQPLRTIPVHLMLDRRIALDHGGRNAWTIGAAGGVYAVPVAREWRLDAYAETGVVGTHRRDLYADGAARIARALDLGGGRSLALGGGVWGAAQPGATRLDLGPSAVLRLPIAHRSVALALDWRERVAGNAKPGSGIAFTLASDF